MPVRLTHKMIMSWKDCITFGLLHISQSGTERNKEDTQVIKEFPRPTTRSELRGFIQLAEQQASELPSFQHNTETLRKLMNSQHAFDWKDTHTADVDRARKMLTSAAVIRLFDRVKQTTILTSASRLHGIGYKLMQTKKEDKPQLVMCGSRGLTNEQANYDTAELEDLAVLYACQSCRHQLQGIETFEFRSTYRPPQGLFQRKMHEVDNTRILRMREKLAEYNFTIEWANGKQNRIAQTLCRAPKFQAIEEELTTSIAIHCFAAATTMESLTQNNDEKYAIMKAHIGTKHKQPTQKQHNSTVQENLE